MLQMNAISELSEQLEGPLGALRMVAVVSRSREEGPPFWDLSEFRPRNVSMGVNIGSAQAPTCPPSPDKKE